MANRELFISGRGTARATDTRNAAGGAAYSFDARHALAQMTATGCFNGTFYESAEKQLGCVLELCASVTPEFIAKTALYSRREGAMKDMPALLCAALSVMSPTLLDRVFDRVVDNGKMLRNFVQMIRSGVCGRRSLGSGPKRLIRRWFANRNADDVFFSATGSRPSFADIIRLAHPRPDTSEREALYRHLLGMDVRSDALPRRARGYIEWKQARTEYPDIAFDLPDAPFLLLMGCGLSNRELEQLVPRLSWTALRMNLAAFARNGILDNPDLADLVARRIADRGEIARARAFPFQAFQTALMVCGGVAGGESRVPGKVQRAVLEALDATLENAPLFAGRKVYVLVDVSGSMSSPITGYRKGATTTTRCVDAAALLATAVLRKNPGSEIIPFEHGVVNIALDEREDVFANARKLASIGGGGGTNTSAPLAWLNKRKAKGDVVLYISDNESWMDSTPGGHRGATATMREWEDFKRRNPRAKMVCLDLQPYRDTQAPDDRDIMNVGGFSDAVFERINNFVQNVQSTEHWVDAIERMVI